MPEVQDPQILARLYAVRQEQQAGLRRKRAELARLREEVARLKTTSPQITGLARPPAITTRRKMLHRLAVAWWRWRSGYGWPGRG